MNDVTWSPLKLWSLRLVIFVVFFGLVVVPGWVWAAHQGHWSLFALGTVLLVGIGGLVIWTALASQRRAGQGMDGERFDNT